MGLRRFQPSERLEKVFASQGTIHVLGTSQICWFFFKTHTQLLEHFPRCSHPARLGVLISQPTPESLHQKWELFSLACLSPWSSQRKEPRYYPLDCFTLHREPNINKNQKLWKLLARARLFCLLLKKLCYLNFISRWSLLFFSPLPKLDHPQIC